MEIGRSPSNWGTKIWKNGKQAPKSHDAPVGAGAFGACLWVGFSTGYGLHISMELLVLCFSLDLLVHFLDLLGEHLEVFLQAFHLLFDVGHEGVALLRAGAEE